MTIESDEAFLQLVSAVLYRAVMDARHEGKTFLCSQARQWLMGPYSELFIIVVGLDVDMVRERLIKTWMKLGSA